MFLKRKRDKVRPMFVMAHNTGLHVQSVSCPWCGFQVDGSRKHFQRGKQCHCGAVLGPGKYATLPVYKQASHE